MNNVTIAILSGTISGVICYAFGYWNGLKSKDKLQFSIGTSNCTQTMK